MARVLGDEIPSSQKPDAAYLVGETAYNGLSVLLRGSELWKGGVVPRIAIQANGEGYGYCGYEYSLHKLKEEGVPSTAIVPMYICQEFIDAKCVNTLSEMISVARLAKKSSWRSIYLVAPHFHQLRSFLTMVTALDKEYPELLVYNRVGMPLPWNESVIHSQGVLTGTRLKLFVEELNRIQAYQNPVSVNPLLMPLVSIERGIAYLNERDRRAFYFMGGMYHDISF